MEDSAITSWLEEIKEWKNERLCFIVRLQELKDYYR